MLKLTPKQEELLEKAKKFVEDPKNLGKIILLVLVLPILVAIISSLLSQCPVLIIAAVLLIVMWKKGVLPF